MRLKSIATLCAAGLVLAGLGSSSAFAKKSKDKSEETTEQTESAEGEDISEMTIEMTGVPSFDSVFEQGADALAKIQDADKKLDDANGNLVSVLGLPEGTPAADALADLKEKAADKLSLTMEGTTPTLSVTDDAPQNVKDGVEAVKTLVDACEHVGETLPQVVKSSKALGTEAAALPAKIPGEIKAGTIKLSESKSIKTKVSNNVQVIKAIPGAAESLGTEAAETLTTLKDTFSS